MTKSDFIKLWAQIKPVVTKQVDGHAAIECDCEFIDYCGGYQLNLRPEFRLWPNEMIFLLSSCELLCCCAECNFYRGLITIY